MEVFILRARDYKNEDYQGFAIKGVFTSREKAEAERARHPETANVVWSLECWEADGNFKWVQFI